MKHGYCKLVGLAFLFSPLVVNAQNLGERYETLLNPLPAQELVCFTRSCDLLSLFMLIIRDILQVIPIFSVVFIIIGGFQMVTSAGNEERLLKAKRTVIWAVLGLVVAMLAFSIIAIVRNFVGVDV
jgi:hypothetical protein